MDESGRKVGIVGAGYVGATTAYTLLLSGLASELALVDISRDKAEGEAMDLRHGIPLCPPADIRVGGYEELAGADIVVLTAGVSQKPGETRIDLLRRNVAVFEAIVPQVVRHAPGALLLVVTNPVDILTHETLRISGYPRQRVIGSGTVLDTSRLRYLLSQHTGIDARNVHAYVLGEHGDTELVAWSQATIAGMPLEAYCRACGACARKLDDVARADFDEQVRSAGYEIIRRKGATYYAVALAVRRIVEAILRDERSILTVSTAVEGLYGLPDVCLSVPCIVGAGGVVRPLQIPLTGAELEKLARSAAALGQALRDVRGA